MKNITEHVFGGYCMLYDCVTHHEPGIKFQISLFIIHQYTIQYNNTVGSIADNNIRPLIMINGPHTLKILKVNQISW